MLLSEEKYISEEKINEGNNYNNYNTNNDNKPNNCLPCKPCLVSENNKNNGILNNTLNNIKTATNSTTATLIGFFWTILGLFAIFLSFKCNERFSFLGLLGSLLFAPFYVAYKLGTKWDVCMAGIIS